MYEQMLQHLTEASEDAGPPSALRLAAGAGLVKAQNCQFYVIATILHPCLGLSWFAAQTDGKERMERAKVLFQHVYESYKNIFNDEMRTNNAAPAAHNVDSPVEYSPLSVGGEMPFHDSTHHSTSAPDPVFNHHQKKTEMGVWTWVSIVGGTLLAGIIGVVHHLFDEHLDARLVSGHWTQTKTSRIEIFLATAFKIFFCFSAGVSLCQLSWYCLRRQPVTYIDALVGEPSLMILYRRNIFLEMPLIIIMTVAILASPVITILTPSLNTRQISAVSRTLTVPTLNTTTDALLNDIYLRCGPLPV
ncbi:hypothetical protein B0H14DRAFT_3430888 [Mycena olivaceomarginata]|nr:hypothetical protein B0H14DRAFT_3430888 [Mycena olivaceomarginata]